MGEAGGTVAPTRGRLSPPLPSPFLDLRLLVLVLLAKLVSLEAGGTVAPTRGRLSLAMPLPLLTTLLEVMGTTSMAPATPTLTGAPRVFTRGRLPATATSLLSAPTVTATTARTPSTVSRSTAMRPTSTRTARDTEAL